MPSVDISSPNQQGAGKEGFGTGLPTPILLALVGGGIGLVVFLSRRTGSNAGTGADKGTLLPNTAIMLGSLQQDLLNLRGDVTTGNADLSSQLTGVGENLGSQIDSQSGMIQQSFADLSTYLQGSLGTIQGEEDALSTAIAGLGSQNTSLAQSMTTQMQHLFSMETQLSQVAGGLQGLSSGTSSGFSTTLSYINDIMSQQNAIQSQLTALGVQIKPVTSPQVYALAPLNRQATEVQQNYAKTYANKGYDYQNSAFLSDYSTNPYHGGYIDAHGSWQPLVMAGPGY